MADIVAQAGGDVAEWQSRPVEKRDPVTEEYEADVVVIGAGIAGLSATLEAASLGADVILVEKMEVAWQLHHPFGGLCPGRRHRAAAGKWRGGQRRGALRGYLLPLQG